MLVTIQNLTVQYGRQTALLIDSPLYIEEGDRIGVIGSNGAGKTTLVKALLGLAPYRGFIRTALAPSDMAVHMQTNNYANSMPVKALLETILNTHIRRNDRLRELIHFFHFEECLPKRFNSLSGGQKQRLTIIMVLMQDAPLTFFDEVTSGLDFESRQQLMGKLKDWYKGRDNTLMIVSHYYDELDQLVNKLLLLDKGRVIAYGSREELFARYCGRAIITMDNTEHNRELTEGFPSLLAPAHLLALACTDPAMEAKLIQLLLAGNVSYKRSTSDIEILSINAQSAYDSKAASAEEGR